MRNAAWSGSSTCCRTSLQLTFRGRPRRLGSQYTKRFRSSYLSMIFSENRCTLFRIMLPLRDLSHRTPPSSAVTMAACVRLASLSRRSHAREEHAMRGAEKVICQAAAVLLLFSVASTPAKAQFLGGGGAGGEDMMTQMAPMLE